ncbi:MAG: GrpB family protein [Chitinispirillaceae bacterium]|nr:GrpB family protein [Chitinispirillaceae bacterium]
MVKLYGKLWDEQLHFSTYLKSHQEERDAYASLKRELAARYPNHRDNYLNGKALFIRGIIRKAEAHPGRREN